MAFEFYVRLGLTNHKNIGTLNNTIDTLPDFSLSWLIIGILVIIFGIIFTFILPHVLHWIFNLINAFFHVVSFRAIKHPIRNYKPHDDKDKRYSSTYDDFIHEYDIHSDPTITIQNRTKNRIFDLILITYQCIGITASVIFGLYLCGLDFVSLFNSSLLFTLLMTYALSKYILIFFDGLWLRYSGRLFRGKYIEIDNAKGVVMAITAFDIVLLHEDVQTNTGIISIILHSTLWSSIYKSYIRMPLPIVNDPNVSLKYVYDKSTKQLPQQQLQPPPQQPYTYGYGNYPPLGGGLKFKE